jgi:Flp pilus assembly protein TadG
VVIFALLSAIVFGMAAMALDLGVAQADRRDLQSDADAASLAGARSLSATTNQPDTGNYVALQYAAKNTGQSMPSGCSVAGTTYTCPAGKYTLGTYAVTLTDTGTTTLDVAITDTRPTLFAAVIGFAVQVTGTSARAIQPGALNTPAIYALVGLTGDVITKGGGTSNPSGDVTGLAYAAGNFGANNGSHPVNLPSTVSGPTGTACSPAVPTHVDVGGAGDSGSFTVGGVSQGSLHTGTSAPSGFTGLAPTTTGATFANGASAAKDSLGHWNPGTYNGWYPSNGSLNPGVYVIKNVTSGIALDNLSNVIAGSGAGTSNTTGAVAFVVDSSDNGSSMNFSGSTLNGLDDLTSSTGTTGTTVDPQGTHNFVVYGSGFTGDTDIGGSTLSGIVYLPAAPGESGGGADWTIDGSLWVASFAISGGGNGTQQINWVCGLGAISWSSQGGLAR